MNNKLLFLLALLFGGNVLYSQWQVQNYYPSYSNSHFISSSNTGWVCGTGVIRKTTNGGAAWMNEYAVTTNTLNDIYFADANTGWAVGGFGEIYYTANGGANWSAQTSGVPSGLYSVHFANSTTGLASGSGGKIVRTTNGGVLWSVVTFNTGAIVNLTMRNASVVYATQDDKFIKSTNGGINWSVAATLTAGIPAVSFVDDNTGYAALGTGLVAKTTNAGVNWVNQVTGSSNYVFDIHFINASTGFLSYYNNEIYRTTNGGTNWSLVHTAVAPVTSFATMNTNQIVGTGSSGHVILSTNSGAAWQVLQQGYSNRVTDIQFINQQTGWAACGFEQLLYTSNNGANWSASVSSGLVNADKVYFLNASTGFTAGISGSFMSGASIASVAKTTNGGINWVVTQFPDNGSAYKLQFVNATDGFVLIRTSSPVYKIYKTSNAGTGWNVVYTTSELMNDIYFTTQLNGWMVGESGKIYKTTNGGTNWSLQTTGVSDQLLAVFFSNNNFGWACGFNGRILATTNGGTNWSQQVSGTTKALTDIEFSSQLIGCAVGEDGQRLTTGNGGANWLSQFELSQSDLETVTFAASTQAFIGGAEGYIASNSSIVGANDPSSQIPAVYSLGQNFPNPFNPATTISFSLPEKNNVNLEVFDINGKLVSTIISGYLEAGEHSYSFNASGYSSGIYFYRLVTGEFSQVNKMILVK